MMDWAELEKKLTELGETLEKPVTLTVIGSAVCMSAGQAGRMTADIDVMRTGSVFDLNALKKACASIGIAFDPKGYDEPENAYLQLIDEGIVQIGKYKETTTLMTVGNLSVIRPPIENIIASKMVRGDDADFADAMFLIKKYSIAREDVKDVINTFKNKPAKETALENLDFLLNNSCQSFNNFSATP